jgi:hypothetical protein
MHPVEKPVKSIHLQGPDQDRLLNLLHPRYQLRTEQSPGNSGFNAPLVQNF